MVSKGKTETPQPEPFTMSDEELALHRHRYREARRAGMSMRDAKLFALELQLDIGAMRALAAQGCPSHLLLRVL